MKKKMLFFTIAGLFLLLLWQIASLLVAKTLLPSPITVILALPDLVARNLGVHLQASLWRIGVGMVLSILLGFVLSLIHI